MDELRQEELELTEKIADAEDAAPESTAVEDSASELELTTAEDAPDEDPEESDEIFFVSDFLLTAEDFLETAQYAYLRVANNSLILMGLIVVFMVSCLTSGSLDYLQFLPIVALIVTVTQVRRYSNTDKDINKAYALMQKKTDTGNMQYHIEFGEFMHITNNGRKTPKHDLNEITAICESQKYWLLCLDQQLYVPVEKGSVTGEHPEEFLDYLRACCKSLKKKKIATVTGKKKQAGYAVVGCVILTVITLLVGFFL